MSVCSSYYVCWQYVCTLYPALFESVMVPKSSDNPVPVLCCFPTLQCSLVFTFYVCVCVCVCSLFFTFVGEICKQKLRSDFLLQRRLKPNG